MHQDIGFLQEVTQMKRKQLHNRRCGYLGCLDNTSNLSTITNWCKQMEWGSLRMNHVSENYEEFEKGMDREDYRGAKKALMNLSQLLGEKHPNVVALQTEYNIEAEE